jgi:hypothetical protein
MLAQPCTDVVVPAETINLVVTRPGPPYAYGEVLTDVVVPAESITLNHTVGATTLFPKIKEKVTPIETISLHVGVKKTLSLLDITVPTEVVPVAYPAHLIVCDYTNLRTKVHLAASLAYVSEVANTESSYVCTDGIYFYVTVPLLHQVRKYRISDGELIWTVGSNGVGDAEFTNPMGICTDGVHLYIVDHGNFRLKKHTCITGSYVAKSGVGGYGLGFFWNPLAICTDGINVYITEHLPPSLGVGTYIKMHDCATLTAIADLMNDGHIDGANLYSICTDGEYLYMANAWNEFTGNAAVYQYTMGMVFVASFGTFGTGDSEFDGPEGIATDGTFLYISDTNNHRVKKHRIDGSYVSQIGAAGDGDDDFHLPKGLCYSSTTALALVHHRVLELVEDPVDPYEEITFLTWTSDTLGDTDLLLVGKPNGSLYLFEASNPLGYYETRAVDFGYPGIDKCLKEVVFWASPDAPTTVTVSVSVDGGLTWPWSQAVIIDKATLGIVHPWMTADSFCIRFSAPGLYLDGWKANADPKGREIPQ